MSGNAKASQRLRLKESTGGELQLHEQRPPRFDACATTCMFAAHSRRRFGELVAGHGPILGFAEHFRIAFEGARVVVVDRDAAARRCRHVRASSYLPDPAGRAFASYESPSSPVVRSGQDQETCTGSPSGSSKPPGTDSSGTGATALLPPTKRKPARRPVSCGRFGRGGRI